MAAGMDMWVRSRFAYFAANATVLALVTVQSCVVSLLYYG
jgi:hypothetical protein